MIDRAPGLPPGEHFRHQVGQGLAKVFALRPQVVLQDHVRGTMSRDALDQFEGKSVGQCDGDPAHPEGVPVPQGLPANPAALPNARKACRSVSSVSL